MYLTVFTALLAVAAASPVQPLFERQNTPAVATAFCSTVKQALLSGHCSSAASTFCSSYLGIAPTGTVTTTSTSTTTITTGGKRSVIARQTVTSTRTLTTTTISAVTSISTVPTGTTTVVVGGQGTCGPPGTKRKRQAAGTSSEPACLSTFSSGTALSSACSCMNIAPGASTTTTVVVSTVTAGRPFQTFTVTPTAIVRTTVTSNGGTTTITQTTSVEITSTNTSPNNFAQPTKFLIYATVGTTVEYAENSNSANEVQFDSPTAGGASTYTLNSSGNLINSAGLVAYEADSADTQVIFGNQRTIKQTAGIPLVCTLDTQCGLTCRAGASKVEEVCSNNVFQVDASASSSCTTISLQVQDVGS